MVDFSSPKQSRSPNSTQQRNAGTDCGHSNAVTGSLLAKINTAIIAAVFIVGFPTILTALVLRFLGPQVNQQSAQVIILSVLGISLIGWVVVMTKSVQRGTHLRSASFTGIQKDE